MDIDKEKICYAAPVGCYAPYGLDEYGRVRKHPRMSNEEYAALAERLWTGIRQQFTVAYRPGEGYVLGPIDVVEEVKKMSAKELKAAIGVTALAQEVEELTRTVMEQLTEQNQGMEKKKKKKKSIRRRNVEERKRK